ncbi:MAG: RNA polymerase sigma factor, partial [Spirochaetaceae bacterium]
MPVDVDAYYRRYAPMVMRRCRSVLKNEEAAMDAMQEVFVRLVRKQDELRDEAPSSLLYTMATNICLNVLRSQGRRPQETVDDEVLLSVAGSDDPEETVLSRHFADRLLKDAEVGPDAVSTRTIATYHYVDGMTLEETAELTGLSVSGVRKRLRKLRALGLER